MKSNRTIARQLIEGVNAKQALSLVKKFYGSAWTDKIDKSFIRLATEGLPEKYRTELTGGTYKFGSFDLDLVVDYLKRLGTANAEPLKEASVALRAVLGEISKL